jgi:hypothetical protein
MSDTNLVGKVRDEASTKDAEFFEGLVNNREINFLYKDTKCEDLEDKNILQNFFYTKPEDALREIELRRSESDFGISDLYLESLELEKLSKGRILGFIHRDITPNLEVSRMIDTCDFMGIHPIMLNYESDIFSCLSRSKYFLGKLGFFSGYGKGGGMKIDFKKIINFDGVEGKKMNEVKTIFGNDLITFHKEIFNEKFHFLERSEFDVTNVSSQTNAFEIYKFIFFLSIKSGFFLEHFIFEGKEKDFIKEIIFPAFVHVWNKTGYRPLVVPFEPTETDDADFWHYYFFNIKDIIENKYSIKFDIQ